MITEIIILILVTFNSIWMVKAALMLKRVDALLRYTEWHVSQISAIRKELKEVGINQADSKQREG